MGDWRKMGHGMRRRMGAPASHHESALSLGGVGMDDQLGPLNAMHQGARAPIGPDVVSAVLGSIHGNPAHNPDMVRAKYQMKLSDPAFQPYGIKAAVVNNSTERMGASFGISTNVAPTVEPAAGQIQANGKIVPSSFPRSDVAFAAGAQA